MKVQLFCKFRQKLKILSKDWKYWKSELCNFSRQ